MGARHKSVVVMGRWIDSFQCSTTGGIYYPVCGIVCIKDPSETVAHVVAIGGCLLYLIDALPYVRSNISINVLCCVVK